MEEYNTQTYFKCNCGAWVPTKPKKYSFFKLMGLKIKAHKRIIQCLSCEKKYKVQWVLEKM